MITDLFLLLAYTVVILAALCIVGIFAEFLLNYQERKEINIKVGDCLRGKR